MTDRLELANKLSGERAALKTTIRQSESRLRDVEHELAHLISPYPVGTIMTHERAWGYEGDTRVERARIDHVRLAVSGFRNLEFAGVPCGVTYRGVSIKKDGMEGSRTVRMSLYGGWKPE